MMVRWYQKYNSRNGQKLKVSFEYADISFDTEHPTNPALQDYNQATLGLQFVF